MKVHADLHSLGLSNGAHREEKRVAQALHRIGKFYVFLREVRAEQVRAPQRLHKEESERRDTIMAAT